MWFSEQAGRTIMNRYHNPLDRFIAGADKALRVLAGVHSASRPSPAVHAADAEMTEQEHRHSAGLMRVNHVGEVCAQALYQAQSLATRDSALRQSFLERVPENARTMALGRDLGG